jgi:hypothetical protein
VLRVLVPGEVEEDWAAPDTEETGMWSRNDLSASLQYSPDAVAPSAFLAAAPPTFPAAAAAPPIAISISGGPCLCVSGREGNCRCHFVCAVAGTRLRVRGDTRTFADRRVRRLHVKDSIAHFF